MTHSVGDLTLRLLREALESRRAGTVEPSSKVVIRHGDKDHYVADWTTENGRLVLLTSTAGIWRTKDERAELVERIISQDRTIRHLRESLSDIEEEDEAGVGRLVAGLHARIQDLQLENEALRRKGAA